jgi:hypothetical protein
LIFMPTRPTHLDPGLARLVCEARAALTSENLARPSPSGPKLAELDDLDRAALLKALRDGTYASDVADVVAGDSELAG